MPAAPAVVSAAAERLLEKERAISVAGAGISGQERSKRMANVLLRSRKVSMVSIVTMVSFPP